MAYWGERVTMWQALDTGLAGPAPVGRLAVVDVEGFLSSSDTLQTIGKVHPMTDGA